MHGLGINGYIYKGYSYEPWDDREDDNIKRYHDVYAVTEDGKLKVQSRSIPASPYAFITARTFKMWIDSGHPTLRDMGLSGNCHEEDIISYHNKKWNENADKALVGEGGD